MDSLLSTYASSSDDEDSPSSTHHPPPPQLHPSKPPSSSLFSTLPKPSSPPHQPPPQPPQLHPSKPPSSLFSTLPKPSLFTSIPPPKSNQTPPLPSPPSLPKRVVQFHPPKPLKHPSFNSNDSDSDPDPEDQPQTKKTRLLVPSPDVKSFLSSIPAPRNSGPSAGLGSGSVSSGTARRSVIDTVAVNPVAEDNQESRVGEGLEVYNNDVGYANYDANYENYEAAYANAGEYQQYSDVGGSNNDWYIDSNSNSNHSGGSLGGMASLGGGKRRKDQPPMEILEVKQDELMKNRPTEDKSKLTGVAFGPSYQPASSKGKPTKLSKRKHQIGSLYFDMKQKEMELAERRAKGFLTKAETQAKYGW